jgi:hypothetical protein
MVHYVNPIKDELFEKYEFKNLTRIILHYVWFKEKVGGKIEEGKKVHKSRSFHCLDQFKM